MPIRLHCQHEARPRRAPVEQNRARAAYPVLAAEMGTGQTKLLADEISQRDADLDFLLIALAIDGQRDFPCVAHYVSQCLPSLIDHRFASPLTRLAATRLGT